jgi:hypothetical protein
MRKERMMGLGEELPGTFWTPPQALDFPLEETHGTKGQCVSFPFINAGSVLLFFYFSFFSFLSCIQKTRVELSVYILTFRVYFLFHFWLSTWALLSSILHLFQLEDVEGSANMCLRNKFWLSFQIFGGWWSQYKTRRSLHKTRRVSNNTY